MPTISEALERLSQSRFRSRFLLKPKDLEQVRKLGEAKLREHVAAFVQQKLAPAFPVNDGKQTPMHGHPAFLAMHGCAMCCRGCMHKWWHVPVGVALTPLQQEKIVNFLMTWMMRQLTPDSPESTDGKNFSADR